jgi:uncharacterized protein
MAETAKTQEPSMEELRARISRIIIDADDKPAQRRKEPTTTAPPLTEPPLRRPDPGSYSSLDDQASAAAISDWPSALLKPTAIPSSTALSIGTSSDPTPAPPSASGLYARESGSAPPLDRAGKQVPMPSMLHAAPAESEQREEPVLGHAGEHLPIPSRLPDAAPGREDLGEPRFGQTGQQVATSTHGRATPGGGGWEQLISRETNNAVHSAFDTLAQTVLLHNARTLEDMVREMLRPILKVWLDDNLPSVVEHLVRAEIEWTRRPVRGKPGER